MEQSDAITPTGDSKMAMNVNNQIVEIQMRLEKQETLNYEFAEKIKALSLEVMELRKESEQGRTMSDRKSQNQAIEKASMQKPLDTTRVGDENKRQEILGPPSEIKSQNDSVSIKQETLRIANNPESPNQKKETPEMQEEEVSAQQLALKKNVNETSTKEKEQEINLIK